MILAEFVSEKAATTSDHDGDPGEPHDLIAIDGLEDYELSVEEKLTVLQEARDL